MRLIVLRNCLFLLIFVLAACRPLAESPMPTMQPSPIPDTVAIPDDVPDYGLVAGGHRMEVLGVVTSALKPTILLPIEYGSALVGMRSPGSNTSGNLGLAITTQIESGGEGVLLLEFADTLGIGTHQVGTNSELNPAPVGAMFRVAGRSPFSERVSGTLTLDFINRRSINGEFDLTLFDSDGQSVTVRGAFHHIPFTPHEEYSVQLNGVYSVQPFEPQFSKGIQDDARFITLRFVARRAFAEPETGILTITAHNYQTLATGEYSVNVADSPISAEVRLGESVIPIESGTVVFIRTSDNRNGVQESIWQGAFTLSLITEAGATTLTGLFNHFDPF